MDAKTQPSILRVFEAPIDEEHAFAEENAKVEMHPYNTYPGNVDSLPLPRNPFWYDKQCAPLSMSGCDACSSPFSEMGKGREDFHYSEIVGSPSVEFTRQVWWAALCRQYNPNPEIAGRMIYKDILHL